MSGSFAAVHDPDLARNGRADWSRSYSDRACVAVSRRFVTHNRLLPPSTDDCGKIDLFDYLVGANEQRGRHVKTEGLGSLEIYDELVLRGRLYGQIGRLLALENAIHV